MKETFIKKLKKLQFSNDQFKNNKIITQLNVFFQLYLGCLLKLCIKIGNRYLILNLYPE